MNIRAVIFDKDGTLFDFQSTWGAWAGDILSLIAGFDAALFQKLASALHYDAVAGKVLPGSLIVAGTPREIATVIQGFKPKCSISEILSQLNEQAEKAPQVLVTDLLSLTQELRYQGLKLCVMTNDAVRVAHGHLTSVGALDFFDHVIGSDSGYGAKPDPAPLLALAAKIDVPAEACLMVGDSTHDLIAGHAAGMRTVGVLTGLAVREDLEDLADLVLPDVSHLAAWISAQNS
ncbi:MAG: HAD family hydrolase [Planktomarina sp.]|nr:HAD family hydrolase [Planktomarina sp.]